MAYRMIFNQTGYFGRGALQKLAPELRRRGFTKAFLITDAVLLETGTAARITNLLDLASFPYDIFSDVVPNPPVENVKAGVKAFQDSGADVIIGLGGGSPQDTAKAIGIIAANPEFSDVLSLEGVADTKNPAVPIIGIPTTAGRHRPGCPHPRHRGLHHPRSLGAVRRGAPEVHPDDRSEPPQGGRR